MISILHICNDFNGSKVHSQLFQRLDRLGTSQTVFVPTRDASVIGRNEFASDHVSFVYANVIRPYHKLLYYAKRRLLYGHLRHIETKVDLVHASTLFSDGGLAYDYYKEFHVPYIVTVRGTDVNEFMKWMPHTWISGIRILLNAQKIIFVSEALKQKFLSSWLVRPILSQIEGKILSIPNGVDDFWLDSVRLEHNDNHKLLYVGDDRRLKNIHRLVEAVRQLRQTIPDLSLTMVGKIDASRFADDAWIRCTGPIGDKPALQKVMREHSVFAMPSLRETFGLVYVEALSQNLALLYTQGQGVDGLFEKAGEAVDARSVADIAQKLGQLLLHRADYSNANERLERFRWKEIADRYYTLYQSLL